MSFKYITQVIYDYKSLSHVQVKKMAQTGHF